MADGLALVTGSNRGTGRAIRTRLMDDGYQVRCLNRRSCPDHSDPVLVDLRQPDTVHEAVLATLAGADGLDVLVLNAVRRTLGSIAELDPRAGGARR